MSKLPIAYCISCAREFHPASPDAFLCPDCGGPPEANAPEPTPSTKTLLDSTPPASNSRRTLLESQPAPLITSETINEPSQGRSFSESDVPAEWHAGDTLLDTYTISGLLGEGGMGKVYRVHHKSWNIDLAVKSPRPEFFQTQEQKDLFISEAETWVNLGLHPHIVSCYYVRTLGGIPRVFAELVEGGSLSDWIELGRITTLEQALDIAIQFAWGLAYAHEQGLVHRDVKPANVLMTLDGTVKVTDFGLVKAGKGMTPAYASPEQAEAQLTDVELTPQSDMWSWGLSILEMFAGRPFWVRPDMPDYAWGQVAPQALEHYLDGELDGTAIPCMPDGLTFLLQACFQPEPPNRPESLDFIADRLVEVYYGEIRKQYSRKKPKAAELRADSLNNKALSLLDLGNDEEAEKTWKEALQTHPNHIDASYNLNRWQWLTGRQPYDTVLVREMESLVTNNPDNPVPLTMLAEIQLERGDAATSAALYDQLAVSSNPAAASSQSRNAVRIAKALALELGENPRKWRSEMDHIYSVSISRDGALGISAGSDISRKKYDIKLWDLGSGKQTGVLQGHTNFVNALVLTPEGRYALSGSSDKTLRRWDIMRRECISVLTGHADSVNSAAMSSDGRYGITGSDDTTIRMWDLESGVCVGVLKGHGSPVKAIALSRDGSRAISGGRDKTVQIWDLDWTNHRGRCIQVFEGHKHDVYSVAITPDGRLGFSGSGYDHTLCAWDLIARKNLWLRKAHEYEVFTLAVTQDGRYVLSGSSHEVRLWDAQTGTCIRTLQNSNTSISGIGIIPDGSIVMTGDHYGFITVWKPGLKNRYKSTWSYAVPRTSHSVVKNEDAFQNKLGEITDLINRGQHELAAAGIQEARRLSGFERHTHLLDLSAQVGRHGRRTSLKGAWLLRTLTGHDKMVKTVDISPDDRFALSGGTDKILRYWDLQNGRCLREMKGHTGYLNHIESAVFSPDGKMALTGSNDLTVRLWNLTDGVCVRTLQGHRGGVHSVAFLPDGNLAVSVSANQEGILRLWSLSNGECLKILNCQAVVINQVCVSSQGRFAVIAADHSMQYWDLAAGEQVFKAAGQSTCAQISPDGALAFTGCGISDRYAVRVWDLIAQSCVRKLTEHKDQINALAITPDGRFICSGGRDRTIRFWEVESGDCVWTLDQFADAITSLKLSKDGRYLLCGCWDSSIHLYQLDWEYEFPSATDWDAGALPYLDAFLILHQPLSLDRISRSGKPVWGESDFQKLLDDLGYHGYGWLRPEGVRRKLDELARERDRTPR